MKKSCKSFCNGFRIADEVSRMLGSVMTETLLFLVSIGQAFAASLGGGTFLGVSFTSEMGSSDDGCCTFLGVASRRGMGTSEVSISQGSDKSSDPDEESSALTT